MTRCLLLVLVGASCGPGESERARDLAGRREARDSLLTMEVVQPLKTPASEGRLIYERPADLSYDSLRAKRPELLLTGDRRKR
jgi:hypothetical protein